MIFSNSDSSQTKISLKKYLPIVIKLGLIIVWGMSKFTSPSPIPFTVIPLSRLTAEIMVEKWILLNDRWN